MLCLLNDKKGIIGYLIFPVSLIILFYLSATNNLIDLTYDVLPIVFPVTYVFYQRRLVMEVTTERVERYKETLKIMSLSPLAYHIGILLYAYIIGLIFTTIIIGISMYSKVLRYYGDALYMFIIILLYSISSTNFSLLIGRFFTRGRLSGELITFINILLGAGTILIMS